MSRFFCSVILVETIPIIARTKRFCVIETLLHSGNVEDSEAYEAYAAACAGADLVPRRPEGNELVALSDGAQLSVLPAHKERYEDDNDYSLLVELQYGSRRFLVAADAEKERLREYLQTEPKPVDFLKVPHHGRENEMTATFLEQIRPSYAVITCKSEDKVDAGVLQALHKVGAQVCFTSNGTVRAVCDGRTLRVSQEGE